jgi:hypothetical protein
MQDRQFSVISVSGTIIDEDIALAKAVHGRGSYAWKALAIVFGILVLLLCVDAIRHHESVPLVALRFAAALGGLAFSASQTFWQPRESLDCEISRTFREDAIYIEDSEEYEVVPWRMVNRCQLTDDMCILYTVSPQREYIFPRRLFDGVEDWDRFRSMMAAYRL